MSTPVSKPAESIGASQATGLSQAEPVVSALRASIPRASDWHYTEGEPPLELKWGTVIWALGRYGDVFGPMPVEMIDDEAWRGNMLHASHDLVAYAECKADWRDIFSYQPRDPAVFGKRATAPQEKAR